MQRACSRGADVVPTSPSSPTALHAKPRHLIFGRSVGIISVLDARSSAKLFVKVVSQNTAPQKFLRSHNAFYPLDVFPSRFPDVEHSHNPLFALISLDMPDASANSCFRKKSSTVIVEQFDWLPNDCIILSFQVWRSFMKQISKDEMLFDSVSM